jgi:hypothetical protein
MVDSAVRDLIDKIEPHDAAALTYDVHTEAFGTGIGATHVCQRVRDPSGQIVGTVLITKPAVGMNMLAMLSGAGDLGHFARMRQLFSRATTPCRGAVCRSRRLDAVGEAPANFDVSAIGATADSRR